MSLVRKMNISLTKLALFESTWFSKTFIDFSSNKFLVETGVINLFRYICGI